MFDDDEFDLPDDLAALADAAGAALAGMGEEFAAGAQGDAAAMVEHLRQAEASTDAAGFGASVTAAFEIAHNLKGQGSTFGYTLVTELAEHLCTLTRPANQPQREALPRMLAFGQAIHDVLAGRLEGDGGPLGARMRAELGISQLPC